jgi:hypothetical protein
MTSCSAMGAPTNDAPMTAESVTLAQARLPAVAAVPGRMLTAAEFRELAQVLPAAGWFANIDNPNTPRTYRNDLTEFMTLAIS